MWVATFLLFPSGRPKFFIPYLEGAKCRIRVTETKDITLLYESDGLSQRQIAKRLGISRGKTRATVPKIRVWRKARPDSSQTAITRRRNRAARQLSRSGDPFSSMPTKKPAQVSSYLRRNTAP